MRTAYTVRTAHLVTDKREEITRIKTQHQFRKRVLLILSIQCIIEHEITNTVNVIIFILFQNGNCT